MRKRRRLIATLLAIGASALVVGWIFWFVDREVRPRELDVVASRQRIAAACSGWPNKGFDRVPNIARAGAVLNAPYGYALVVPAGLRAYSAPDAQGSLGILLSAKPRAYLRVQALYDSYYDITAANVHRRDAGGVRLHDRLLGDTAAGWSLDGTAGGRYRMLLQCPGDPQTFIHDDVIVMRGREIYRVDLQTTPVRAAADTRLMDALLRSWRWLPISPS